MKKELPKPTIIEISRWQKDYLSIRMPTMSWDDYRKEQTKEWYRYWYYKLNKS